MKTFSTTLLAISIIFFFRQNLSAAHEVSWIGQSGNWNDTSNWDCSCIPGPNHFITIDSGEVTIPLGTKALAFSIEMAQAAILNNYDTLQISNDSITGFWIYGEVNNQGFIHILDAVSNGIYNQGRLNNFGKIRIEKIGDPNELGEVGLSVYNNNLDTAYLDNYGIIEIEASVNKHGLWAVVNYQIVNHSSGSISVIGSGGVGTGINVNSGRPNKWVNYGLINVTGGEIAGPGRFDNYGEIYQHHEEDNPQYGNFVSSFYNWSGAIFSQKNISTVAFIFNDTVVNEGTILIDSTGGDGISISSGVLHQNRGVLEVQRCGRFAMNISNGGTFRNETGSTLILKKTDENAVDQLGNNSYFYNNGHIIVDSIGQAPGSSFGEHGIALRSGGVIINDSLGVIDISNVNGTGMVKNSNLLCENFGIINISKSGQDGFKSSGTMPFYNRRSGKMYFSESEESGLLVAKPSFFGVGSFTNQGYIEADSLMGDYGIENTQTLINDTCGTIVSYSRIRNSSTFTNYGALKCRGVETHTFTSGNGKNEGIIEDYHGLFSGTSFVNNRILLSPKLTNGCSVGSINDFLDLGSQNNFHITNIYRDNVTWQSGGTFDSLTNTLTLEPGVAGYTPLLVEIENLTQNYLDTFRIQVQTSCPVSCPNEPAFWTGCGGITQNWTDATNWSTGVVPGTGDPVLINGNPASGQFPFVDATQTIGSLLMLPGAFLTLEPGQTLIIEN